MTLVITFHLEASGKVLHKNSAAKQLHTEVLSHLLKKLSCVLHTHTNAQA